ncbi:ribosome small subunit-dependent GTPase A [Lapidilactobacillus wuchangensis]|uniref:ribosome small subunit-dependent GTPase A n=1 Tax=Lapidilactobacillus wuchangensis TaxID=2486001 RepID=UPI000F76E06D|nr:ribosome small subunit-dependent GTPase A [Lapidilactobacillus wuchangensis]
MESGKIIKSISGFYDVLTPEGTVVRTRARGNFRKQGIKPIVGDLVDFADAYILKVEPRQNQSVRPPVANLDVAVVVISAAEPAFSTNLLDRYLVYLAAQNIKAIIYVSKTDLLSAAELAELTPIWASYREIGYDLLIGQQEQATQFTQLLQLIAEQQVMVMGQSGAGKSTLLNHLFPQLQLPTAAISQSLNRGRHTTRTVTLYPFGKKGLIADTPGFSSLELTVLAADQLANCFPEFVALADQCRFRGCLHLQEPGCAVKAALEQQKIANFRYRDYQQMYQEIAAQKPVYR